MISKKGLAVSAMRGFLERVAKSAGVGIEEVVGLIICDKSGRPAYLASVCGAIVRTEDNKAKFYNDREILGLAKSLTMAGIGVSLNDEIQPLLLKAAKELDVEANLVQIRVVYVSMHDIRLYLYLGEKQIRLIEWNEIFESSEEGDEEGDDLDDGLTPEDLAGDEDEEDNEDEDQDEDQNEVPLQEPEPVTENSTEEVTEEIPAQGNTFPEVKNDDQGWPVEEPLEQQPKVDTTERSGTLFPEEQMNGTTTSETISQQRTDLLE